VIRFNSRLFEQLDVQRFFYSVRPLLQTYRSGDRSTRAMQVNFSGINEIDCCWAYAGPTTRTTHAARGQDAVHARRTRPGCVIAYAYEPAG